LLAAQELVVGLAYTSHGEKILGSKLTKHKEREYIALSLGHSNLDDIKVG
jgi:hypothetical protein